MRKTKNLFSIIINECQIQVRIRYNSNTNHIDINETYNYNKKYNKQYYINNKNEINKRCKQYDIDNKDKLRELNKQYYINNKNKISKYRKQYYNDHLTIKFLKKDILTDLPKVKGGYVRHHYIYDHLNISDYVIELSRSDHTKLHHQMKREGIEIQHINVRVNDFKGF